MDDALEQIIATLPDVPARDYDGLSVTQDYLDRLVKSHLANAGPSDAPIPTTFAGITVAGITVVANPHIPDGYAVMTRGGEPVGVINFKGRYRAHDPA
jgi:hypothetical protein